MNMHAKKWQDYLNRILKEHEFATLRPYFKGESFPETSDPVSPAAQQTEVAIRETQKVNLK